MATRTHVVLSNDVLEELDRIVGKRKRSQFIEEAVREKLIRERQRKALRETAGILKDYDYPDWATPELTSAWVRKQRQLDDEHLERKLGRESE